MKLHRIITGHKEKAHLPPGTLVYTGSAPVEKPRLTLIKYNRETIQEIALENLAQFRQHADKDSIVWINVEGLSDIEAVETIGAEFGVHPLVLEDILHTSQRPKFEDNDDYIFVVARMLGMESGDLKINSEQVSFIIGKNFMITFQEYPGDVFEPVRNRIRHGKGQIRKMGVDYLAYALLDGIVDNYFVVMETLGEEAEVLENELVTSVSETIRQRIYTMKRLMINLRRSVWPLREVISAMERSESGIVSKRTRVYIRDLYDHTIQVIDTVESLRDVASGMLDTYLSVVSNRMNEVMKVLTIMATIFIPLTFIAGVYGMNFEYMPELHYVWAYPATLLVMVAVSIGMLLFFRKRKWI
jgi:magnesium transporter